MRKTAVRQLPVAVAVAVLLALAPPGLAAAAAGAAGQSLAAPAAAGVPNWWDGNCDAKASPGSHPLGASYQGVPACGPGPGQGGHDRLVRFFPGAWGEYEWECVELVMRYMYLVYGVAPYNANGNSVVRNYSGGTLEKVANDGSGLPVPGDILSEAGTPGSPDGHAAVVTAVNVHGGSGTVTIMQQNAAPDGWGTIGVSHNVLAGRVTGWLQFSGGGSGGAPSPGKHVAWSFENLDGDSWSAGRSDASLGQDPAAVTYHGALHVFYYDRQHGNLRHAWYSGGRWHFAVLDGAGGARGRTAGNAGAAPSAAVYQGVLHVFYYDASARALRHAWYSRSGWHAGVLDRSGGPGRASAAIAWGGTLQVFYPARGTGALRHAWKDSTGWHRQDLDGSAGSVAGRQGRQAPGAGSSLALTRDGTSLQLFYYGAGTGTLRHAWREKAGGWHFENLDGGSAGPLSGDSDTIGQQPSAVAAGGTLHVFAYDSTTGDLRHDWRDRAGWHFGDLDGPSTGPDRFRVGQDSAAAVDGGTLELFYYDSTWGELRHAWHDTGGWHFANLDGLGGRPASREGPHVRTGLSPCALVYRGARQLFYYDASGGNLRHAWSRPGLAGPAVTGGR